MHGDAKSWALQQNTSAIAILPQFIEVCGRKIDSCTRILESWLGISWDDGLCDLEAPLGFDNQNWSHHSWMRHSWAPYFLGEIGWQWIKPSKGAGASIAPIIHVTQSNSTILSQVACQRLETSWQHEPYLRRVGSNPSWCSRQHLERWVT